MAITIGYGAGFIILVSLAIIVGYKFYHSHMMDGGMTGSAGTQPNAVNPAYNNQTSASLKY